MRRALLIAAGVVLLAGCTGVPTSSSPDTIEALDTGGSNAIPAAHGLRDGARLIVSHFLDANARTTSGGHPTARQYLTPAANTRWTDESATIIGNDVSISTYNRRRHTVVVRGRVLGTVNAEGIYTPSLLGAGGGGGTQPFVFGIAGRPANFRINQLRPGLLLTERQFRDTYRQQVLYFPDLTEDTLVPDIRWSSIEGQPLLQWLMAQIVAGPRPELTSAVSTDTLPAHLEAQQIKVTLGNPVQIQIPGSSQLAARVRYRLAAQLSQTLLNVLFSREIEITDRGRPVPIPSLASDEFSAADFGSLVGPEPPASEVYYLSDGRIHDQTGKLLDGGVENSPPLSSFAVSRVIQDGPMLIAGVTGSGSAAQLMVGTRSDGLRPTSVRGPLSRPAFVPGRDEVWIGAGSAIYRVTVGYGTPQATQVPIPAVSGGGQVVALRLSPEGTRVAMVVSGADGSQQMYVGAIVRGAGQVRVDKLEPISPKGVVVTDVAWLDSSKLFAIGYLARSQRARTFETVVDGTDWTSMRINLPGAPDSVTAAISSSVWASANGYVWVQSGSTTWVSPGPAGQTLGTAPTYLE